jgi:hypothetical protein
MHPLDPRPRAQPPLIQAAGCLCAGSRLLWLPACAPAAAPHLLVRVDEGKVIRGVLRRVCQQRVQRGGGGAQPLLHLDPAHAQQAQQGEGLPRGLTKGAPTCHSTGTGWRGLREGLAASHKQEAELPKQ